jgi:hypothetical protein
VVGEYTGLVFALGVAFGAAAGVGFVGTLAPGMALVAGGGAAVAGGCLEHAAQTPRSTAMVKRLLIGGLLF